MTHHHAHEPDFGTGKKKLSIYTAGMVVCVLLTIAAFHVAMSGQYERVHAIAMIFTAAVVQFLVQVFCFLRLNTDTEQGVVNLAALAYTIVILLCIVAGSLWIMANTNYYMSH